MRTLLCKHCDKVYNPGKTWQAYCSGQCRKANHKKRKRAKQMQKKCAHCNQGYQVALYYGEPHCSTCYLTRRSIRRNERKLLAKASASGRQIATAAEGQLRNAIYRSLLELFARKKCAPNNRFVNTTLKEGLTEIATLILTRSPIGSRLAAPTVELESFQKQLTLWSPEAIQALKGVGGILPAVRSAENEFFASIEHSLKRGVVADAI